MTTDLIKTWEKNMTKLDAKQAETMIQKLCAEMDRIEAREVQVRMVLGHVLLEIQTRELWKQIHGEGTYKTWTDFLELGFPKISGGLKDRSANDAMQLARSQTLAALPEPEREKISLSNARTIARMERAGEKVTPEVVRQAQDMPHSQFRRATGAAEGFTVKLWVPDAGAGQALQAMLEVLRFATASAILAFMELFQGADLAKRAGDGADNKIDCILGTICNTVAADFRQEEAQLPAVIPEILSLDTPRPAMVKIDEDLEPELLPASSAARRADAITGLVIEVRKVSESRWFACGWSAEGTLPARAGAEGIPIALGYSDVGEEAALDAMIGNNWWKLQLHVAERQRHRCAHCGKIVDLQLHHIKFRSHGRDDRVANLEALCAKCHHVKHGVEIQNPSKSHYEAEKSILPCMGAVAAIPA
jgi:hypothetical protein